MEAVIVAAAALFAIVMLEAGYWIAMSLARWSPLIAISALVGWLAHRYGADRLEALVIAAFAFLVLRHLARRRWRCEDDEAIF